MKKWAYIYSVLIVLFVISGCAPKEEEPKVSLEKTEESIENQLNKVVKALSEDKEIAKYATDIKFEKDPEYIDDDVNLYYIITGKLDDSYDEISHKEQYELFSNTDKVIRDVLKDQDQELTCDNYYLCDFREIKYTTSADDYTMTYFEGYRDEHPITFETSTGMEYDVNGYVEEDEGEDESSSISPSTADGYDWAIDMGYTQKEEAVSLVLTSLEAKGYTINESPWWFVDALDAFYGKGNSTTITEAVVFAGVGESVIIEP